jgi:PAS domain S-box-containing protein
VKLQSRHIFIKSILIALIFGLFFWVAESVAHMFYFSETFEYFLNHEPLTFMDAFIYHVPKYSLFIRLICIAATLIMGGVIGLLLERDNKRTAALLDRERDYHEAINAVNQGIFTYFTDTKRINASSLCYSMLGYAKDEIGDSRETFYSLVAPGEREEIRKSLKKHIAEGKSFSFELKMKTKEGKGKWIQLQGNVQESNEDGSAKRIVGIVVDISQRMEVQNQLAHYTACLEEAEKVAHVGHWEFDYKNKNILWSQEVSNILQIAPAVKIVNNQRVIMNLVHPEDKKQTRVLFLESIRKKCNFDYTYRIVLKDKSIKYISQNGHHVFDKNGHIVRSFGTIQDVTQNSLATQNLANSEKRYRTLFDNVYQGIVIIDQKTQKIKLANKVFCELSGYTQKEILSCSLKDLHPSENFTYDSSWVRVEKKAFVGVVEAKLL